MTRWPVGQIKCRAKVQIGAELLCKSAKEKPTSGDGCRARASATQVSASRPSAAGAWSRLPKAERPIPERPMPRWPSPVTRYVPLTFAPLHKPKSGCTFALLDSTPHPHLYLITRTRDLRAETWDPRMSPTFAHGPNSKGNRDRMIGWGVLR